MKKPRRKAPTARALIQEPKRSIPKNEQAVGPRVRFLRQQRNITLDQLSQLAGLTKSFISKVERGVSVPSISTAMKIAEGLKLTVSQLLGEEPSERSVCLVRKNERRSFMRAGSDVGYNYELMAAPKEFKRMEPYMMRPPLRFQDNRKFDHVGEEFMLVLSGSMLVEIAEKQYELNKGDALYFDAHVPHRSRSLGGRFAEVLVVVTGETVSRKN